jgi:CRP-like cAMP-binding protein
MFNHLNEEEIKDFLSHFEKKRVKAGEIIIKEGEKNNCAFVLIEDGEIEVSRKTYKGKEYIVAIIHPEDKVVFNETALIDEKGSFSTLKALKDSLIER